MGYLELIIGPMFSGKTSELIRIYDEKKQNETVLAINYDKDTRYGTDCIISHDNKSIPSININQLIEINIDYNISKLFEKATTIFINEAQFFKDIKLWILKYINTDKNFILCALDSDFKRERFGDLLDLIPHANKLTKLYGKCTACSEKSLYTHRVSHEKQQELIGVNNYIPVCRNCYNELNSPSNISDNIECNL